MQLHCDQCKQFMPVHAVLDSDVWERIAGDDYCLCPTCIDGRLANLGITAECELVFVGSGALQSLRTPRVERAAAWRPREYIANEGVGLPILYRSI